MKRTSSQSPKSPMDDQPKRKNLGTLTPEEKREYRRAQNRIDQRRRAEKVKSRADSLRNKARQKHKAIEQKISQVDQHIEHLQRYLKEVRGYVTIPSIQEKNLLIFKELSSTTPITKSEKATIMENTQKIDSIIEKISVMEAKEEKPKFSENNDDIASEISFTPARYVKTDELMKMPAWKRCRVRRQMEEQKLENACDQLDKKCEKIDKVIQAYEAKIYLLLKESVSALRQIAQIISRLRNRAQIPETRAKTLDYDLDDMTKTIDVLETHAQLRASTTKSMADCLLPLQI
ncbi:hypothetical protein WR25_14081 [Diploscapter pachys]|uniref:Uncharacterized protein n=1 Tax=Diploscapter pachys TaxID=2018661 RepID=A0A2A2KTB2_9BILA|nr:hypothetical protein WR25_14081 [Diploscapter pachys]